MSLSSESRLELWEKVNNIKAVCGFSDDYFRDLLGLSKANFTKFSKRNRSLSLDELESLLSKVSVSPEVFFTGQIDYEGLANRFVFGRTGLPSKYLVGTYSKKRTSTNVLSYIKRTRGDLAHSLLLRRFQATPRDFENADETICMSFLVDLCQAISETTNAFEFRQMGFESYELNKEGPLGKLLQGSKSWREVFSRAQDSGAFDRFDENFSYSVELKKDGSVVCSSKVTELAKQHFKTTQIGSEATCQIRAGVMAAMPKYSGFQPIRVVKTACVLHGDPECRFEGRPA